MMDLRLNVSCSEFYESVKIQNLRLQTWEKVGKASQASVRRAEPSTPTSEAEADADAGLSSSSFEDHTDRRSSILVPPQSSRSRPSHRINPILSFRFLRTETRTQNSRCRSSRFSLDRSTILVAIRPSRSTSPPKRASSELPFLAEPPLVSCNSGYTYQFLFLTIMMCHHLLVMFQANISFDLP